MVTWEKIWIAERRLFANEARWALLAGSVQGRFAQDIADMYRRRGYDVEISPEVPTRAPVLADFQRY